MFCSVRADGISGQCASTVSAEQAMDVPASLQQAWGAPELGSDPISRAGAVFQCPTGS